jgi:predicted ATP-binding protein involved in virulence
MMGSKLEKFCIKNLYGYKSFEVEIEDNKLILVGENGSSKSTIVSMFYYFLTKQWKKLRDFEFDEMSIIVDSKEFKISRQELLSTTKNRYKTIQYILERLKELNITPDDARRNLTPDLARKILNGPNAPIRMPFNVLNSILNEIGFIRRICG